MTMCQEQGKQQSGDMVRMDSNLPHLMGFQKSAEPFQRLGLDEPLAESSDSYTCELCQKPCGNRTNYFVHLRIKHAEELPYECGMCEIRFSTETILRDHILTSHSGERKDIIKCHVCGAMFREKHYLHAHMLTHNEYSPFPCHICRKTFIKKKDLQKHIYSHEETKTFPCPMCKRVYQQARYLEVHLRRPCNPFICQDCSKKPQVPEDPASSDNTTELGRTSISKENYTEQVEAPTATEQQLSCKICGTAFARLEDSTGHKCKVYQCSVCSKNFCPSLLTADWKSRSSEETPVCDTCSQAISLSDEAKKEQSASTVVEKTVHCQVCLKKMPKPIFKACAVKETANPPQRFSCRICGYTYFRRWSLLKHVKVHEREHKYLCATCDTVFNKKKAYRRHMKIHEARRHKCSECNETFSKEKHLEKHKQLHSEGFDHEYICATCGMVFNEKKAYRQHRKIHGLNRKKCSTCNETFSKKKHLEKHKQLQLEGYNVCNRSSNSKNKCEKHKCQVCSKSFIHIKNLIKHEKSHLLPVEKYTCVECWKSFPLKSMLMDHMKIHERTSKPSTEYVCNICKLSCVNELHLYNHKRIHAGFKISACDICGKSFNRRYDLIEHRESVHSQFMCKICGKGFPNTGELEVHNKDKHAEDHLVCNICDKVCVNQLHLKNHCLIHAGRKLCVCEFCGCGFTRRYNLVKHMESHTGQKPHCCDICHEGFSETSDLLLHRKIHDEDHPGLVIGDDFIKKEDTSQ